MEILVVFGLPILFGIDILVYLIMLWNRWTDKRDIEGIHSPIYRLFDKIEDGHNGDSYVFFFFMSLVSPFLMHMIYQLGMISIYVLCGILSLVLFSFGVRALKTLFKAIKKLGVVAHRHSNQTDVVDIDIESNILTEQEMCTWKKINAKIERAKS
jgi:hypothetical protein